MGKRGLDFVVVGAQKCGTTSLFAYMRGHPELCLPPGKEAPYFSNDAKYRVWGWEEYLARTFPDAEPGRRCGTITPQYMFGGLNFADPDNTAERGHPRTVPSRIYERAPGARVIAILRDPVERARSHHAMARRNGWDTRSFAEAAAELLDPDALAGARDRPQETTGYITWGEYGRILSGYFDVFPAEQILVVFTSDLGRDPAGVVKRVFDFLAVDTNYEPASLGTVYRPSRVDRYLPWLDFDRVRDTLDGHPVAVRAWRRLPAPARQVTDGWFTRLEGWVDRHNRRLPPGEFPLSDRASAPAPAVETDEVPELRAHFAVDGDLLTELVGAPPPWLVPALAA
jgi:hypothetical protein